MHNYSIRYLGVVDDPSLAPGSIHELDHVLAFRSLEDAGLAAELFYLRGSSRLAFPAKVEKNSDLYGGVDYGFQLSRSLTITLYRVDCKVLDDGPRFAWEDLISGSLGDPYPNYQITIGPRGGIVRTRVY
jgi:hypothetical protein